MQGRSLGGRFATVLVAVILGLVLLAACASDDDPTATPTSPAASQPTATPTPSGPKVDRLVFGLAMTDETNNPLQDTSRIVNQIQLRPMYEYLIGIDADTGQFTPGLATEWTIEADGTAIRFKLREGVQFHGGFGEFTAKDVVRSFDLVTAEDAITGNSNTLRRLIAAVDIIGDHEVVIRLTRPDAEFLLIISEITVGGEMVSAAHADQLGVRASLETVPLVGTGPYEFASRNLGENLLFKRFADYWGEAPDFPELEWRNIPEASSRLAALRTGEIHIAPLPEDLIPSAVSAGLVVSTGNAPGFRVAISWEGTWRDLDAGGDARLQPDNPYVDLNVRKALNKAIDRDTLNDAFFKGEGELMMVAQLHPLRPGWNPDWLTRFDDEYGYDPAAAEQLLRDSGYTESNPLKARILSIPINQLPPAQDVIDSIWSMWGELPNVDISLDTGDPAGFSSQRRALELEDAAYVYATSSYTQLGIRVYNSSSLPRLGYEMKAMDDLWTALRAELNPEPADALIRQWGDLAFANHASIPLFWLPTKAVVNPEFVAEYNYPGNISGTYTHFPEIKGVR